MARALLLPTGLLDQGAIVGITADVEIIRCPKILPVTAKYGDLIGADGPPVVTYRYVGTLTNGTRIYEEEPR